MRASTQLTLLGLALGLSVSCGKSVKKSESSEGAAAGEVTGEPTPDYSSPNAKQNADGSGSVGNEDQFAQTPGGDTPTPPGDPSSSEIPSSYSKVDAGGSVSGLTPSGEAYFAEGENVFFNFSAATSGGKTYVLSHIWFKDSIPETPIKGELRKGLCDDGSATVYQHVAGQSGPASELELSFEGSQSPVLAKATLDFIPRNEPLSLVIPISDEITLCSEWPEAAKEQAGEPPNDDDPAGKNGSGTRENKVVENGGNVTGFLEDGSVYFAPGDTVFYTARLEVSDKGNKLSSEVFFKEAAPAGELQGRLMNGSCSDSEASVYQHIAGNNTQGESELRLTLSGADLKKAGSAIGAFAPRKVPLSYVLDLDSQTSVCLDLGLSDVNGGKGPSVVGSDGDQDGGDSGLKVVDGDKNQVLPDGTVVFAPNVNIWFNVFFTTTGSKTTVTAAIHSKKGASNAPLESFIHSGTCENAASTRYQHIKGDSTPVKSELHVPLKGAVGDVTLSGSGTGDFAFRDEPISYVIMLGSQRLCANFVTQ